MLHVVVLAAAFAAAAAAETPTMPAQPGVRMSPERLDLLFDGKPSRTRLVAEAEPVTPPPPGHRRILYSESDIPLPAPRFSLDLSAVPEEFRNTIPGFERLPHKNQEETQAEVDRRNKAIRRYNAGRSFGKVPEWTYDGRLNEPVWNCLAHGAGTSNDWWAQQLGRELPEHRSITHGGIERGLDPGMLEFEYFRRSNSEDPDYVVPPKFIQEDPVRHTGFPYEPRGYAKLLVEDEPYDVSDPVTGEVYHYRPEMSAMEGEYLQLFTNSIFRERTPAKYAKVLAEGIDRWGIAYVQLEHTEHPRWPGAHAVAVVGYFCMEPGERLTHCRTNRSAEDWERTAYFIAHDSFGNFPASTPRTAHSASAYRAVRIFSIDQAIVFPHGLRVTLTPRPGTPGVWNIAVANNGGMPVAISTVKSLGPGGAEIPVLVDVDGKPTVEGVSGDALHLYVEAPHYFSRDGKGRGFTVLLDAEKARTAVPLSAARRSAEK